jgi:hypothetical protein
MLAALAALASLTSVGCDEMPAPSPVAPPAPAASAPSASAPSSAADATDIEAVAKAYLDAAKKYSETCMCSSDPFEGLIRDNCKVKGPELDAVIAARAGVDARLASPGSLDPAAGAFLREAQLHATWLAEYSAFLQSTSPNVNAESRLIRGGVYAYQRLARLWNAWHPAAPISGIAYGAYWPGGVSSAERSLWVAVSHTEWPTDDPETMLPGGKGRPRYLPWIECIDGPCLVGY